MSANSILEQLKAKFGDQLVAPIPKVGAELFGLSKNPSYLAAARGDLPTVQIGGRKFVSLPALAKKLENAA